MHLSFKSVCNKEHKRVICNMTSSSNSSQSTRPRVILPKALVLKDECSGKNYSSFLDFPRNYERTSGIFVPCLLVGPLCLSTRLLGCLVCVICNSQQFSFLYFQTLHKDCSHIENVRLLFCAHFMNMFPYLRGVEQGHYCIYTTFGVLTVAL